MKKITLATLGVVPVLFQLGCGSNHVTNNYYQDVSSQWVLVSTLDLLNGVSCLGVFKNYLFAGTYDFGIYRSSDNGMSWSQTGFPDTIQVTAFVTSGSTIFAGTYGSGVYRSSELIT